MIDEQGTIVLQGKISLEHLGLTIERLIAAFQPDVVIVERLPQYKPDAKQVEVIAVVTASIPRLQPVAWVGPGEWKPFKDLAIPLKGVHDQDAVRMAEFYRTRRRS